MAFPGIPAIRFNFLPETAIYANIVSHHLSTAPALIRRAFSFGGLPSLLAYRENELFRAQVELERL
jgi:hypothetical protein